MEDSEGDCFDSAFSLGSLGDEEDVSDDENDDDISDSKEDEEIINIEEEVEEKKFLGK